MVDSSILDPPVFSLSSKETQSAEEMLPLYVSANQGRVETLHFFMFQSSILCCDNAVLQVRFKYLLRVRKRLTRLPRHVV